jgi:hypothetical protein
MNDDLHSGWLRGPRPCCMQSPSTCSEPLHAHCHLLHTATALVCRSNHYLILRLPLQQLERLYASLHEHMLVISTRYMLSDLHFGNEPANANTHNDRRRHFIIVYLH